MKAEDIFGKKTKEPQAPPLKKLSLTLKRGDTNGVFEVSVPLLGVWQTMTTETKTDLANKLRDSLEALLISAGLKERVKVPEPVAE